MAIRSTNSIYKIVEDRLRQASSPMTVTALMEFSDVREEALAEWGGKDRDLRMATNKLSDILGFMWRREVITRFPAPRTTQSFARYAYGWPESPKTEPESKPLPPPTRFGKTQVGITEHADCVEIEFDKFTILIRPK